MITTLLLTIVVREILPPVPRRLSEGCWPVRVMLWKEYPNTSVRVQVNDGDRVVAVRSGQVKRESAQVNVPCVADALGLTYRLEFFANGKAVPHTFDTRGLPPRPPPGPELEQECDIQFLREPESLPRFPTGDVEITAMRVQGYSDGTPRFHDLLVRETKAVPPETAAEVLRILNDPRTYGCSGMGCLATGLAFRIRAGDRTIDLGLCLECHYLHFYPGTDHIPLSTRGARELTEIYRRLFRVP